MLIQTLAIYIVVSAIVATIAVLLAKRRFGYDWCGYFVVGLVGGWIGGALFGSYGLVISGISVFAVAVCDAALVEADYCIDCSAEDANAKLKAPSLQKLLKLAGQRKAFHYPGKDAACSHKLP